MFGVSGTGDTSGFGGLETVATLPGGSDRPYGGYFDEGAAILAEVLAEMGIDDDDAVAKVVIDRGESATFVGRAHQPVVATALRHAQDLRFDLCPGASGVHYPQDEGRELHVVYPLNSITHNRTIRLEVTCPDSDPHIPSVTHIYPANNWHEREVWDFFGVIFDGHPSLTRIQMPDDWVG